MRACLSFSHVSQQLVDLCGDFSQRAHDVRVPLVRAHAAGLLPQLGEFGGGERAAASRFGVRGEEPAERGVDGRVGGGVFVRQAW